MHLFKNMLNDFFYLVPRMILFSVFLACLLITVFISFDPLRPYMHPLETFRWWAAHAIQG